jgi:predicted CxxxxCH...CXXCH cytochrome family protein
MNGTKEVNLVPPGGVTLPLSTRPKDRNATTALYDPDTGKCSGVYCHSSGQDGTPTYVLTPTWTSTAKIACNGCHANPPKYTSGGAGTATANSHVQLDTDNWPWGHWGLPMTNYTSQHGQGWVTWTDWYTGETQTAYFNSAPVTCQTCHFDTTDPTNTGPGGFYYLDTTGDYALPNRYNYNYSCTPCHGGTNLAAPAGSGKVLPLRHVNGYRDVDFDPRTDNPNAAWTPTPANDPSRPYWITDGSRSIGYWDNTNTDFRGTTVQFDLSPARYNPADKTCTNVTCHMSQGNTSYTGDTIETRFYKLQWGSTYYYMQTDPATGIGTCSACHRM